MAAFASASAAHAINRPASTRFARVSRARRDGARRSTSTKCVIVSPARDAATRRSRVFVDRSRARDAATRRNDARDVRSCSSSSRATPTVSARASDDPSVAPRVVVTQHQNKVEDVTIVLQLFRRGFA